MSATIEKGYLKFPVDDLLRDEKLLRELAKYAMFDEIALHALAEVFVHGQIDWKDGDDLPWYISSSSFGANFERARRKLCELAPEGAQKLLEEMDRERNRAVEDRDIYRTRAWRAENLLRRYERLITLRAGEVGTFEDMAEIKRITSQPAHAERTAP